MYKKLALEALQEIRIKHRCRLWIYQSYYKAKFRKQNAYTPTFKPWRYCKQLLAKTLFTL
jgi:hypothetical protein